MARFRCPSTIFTCVLPVLLLAVFLYQLDSVAPATNPERELVAEAPGPLAIPKRNSLLLLESEKIGFGQLIGPEDIAYDNKTGVIYTGCNDGWIRRVILNNSAADTVVEEWVNTGGRPLGVALGLHGELIVADAYKGLLNITPNGTIILLTNEAEGLKFKLTDGVDVADDGMIYFTDASYKYNFAELVFELLEDKPHGRFLSYNPTTKETKVLVRDLYVADGVTVSPDQSFVIYCETTRNRCPRYYIQGERNGTVGTFIENLPGLPDNIRYDAQRQQYWLGIDAEKLAIPLVNGGAISVDLNGTPTAYYYDVFASFLSVALQIGDFLYIGSPFNTYYLRINVTKFPAIA